VAVLSDDGTVTLRGQVRSFYEKQLCHHTCRRVAGVLRLVDEIEVAAAYEPELLSV
jgi:osmotically-inducible protein OsmY